MLVKVDGKMPNLAYLKISSYYKARGDQVGFDVSNPDIAYLSCVFSKNAHQTIGRAAMLKAQYPDIEVKMGGPGFGIPTSLPDEIEHRMPDYSLYPEIDYSLGFTTRGCIRNCPFCIVPQIEGSFRENAQISEFHNPEFDKLVLWDNNLLASKKLYEKLDYIKNRNLKVSFNQGLDARLVTEKMASELAEVKSYNLHFTKPFYYFSWDLIEDEENVLRGLRRMIDAGVPARCLMVYVLVGFNSTHEQDYYRFQKLRELGADSFIMKYNNRRDDKWLNRFARWVNKRIYKSCELSEYNSGG